MSISSHSTNQHTTDILHKERDMDLQTLKIESKDIKSNYTCAVILTFELVEYSYMESLAGASSHCVLHRVQLEPTEYGDLRIDVPLDDSDVREHFEGLLSSHQFGYDVVTAVAA